MEAFSISTTYIKIVYLRFTKKIKHYYARSKF